MQYGLIGEHLTHSYSCEIHSSFASYDYELLELKKEELDGFLKKRDFKAINVTIPYKQSVIPYLDCISDTAKSIGAVNTIVNMGSKLYGYNTDFYGMLALLNKNGIDIKDKKVAILGTGGTSKTAKAVCEHLGANSIIKVSRTAQADAVTYDELYKKHSDTQVIINTTPVGMYPNCDSTPVDITAFSKLSGVADAIYHPLRTNLVLYAENAGIKACGGLYMLSAQAVYAYAKFLDREPALDFIEKAYSSVQNDKRNIVLIGMPSAGKTTVGKKLEKLTNKKFIDTDDEIISIINMPISDYFAKYGEQAFRKIESEVISSLSTKSGLVIATGGGAILNADNRIRLKQNGTVVFLDRDIKNLITTPDRPLSSNKKALESLFENRYPIYKECADVIIDANSTVDEVANTIKRKLSI